MVPTYIGRMLAGGRRITTWCGEFEVTCHPVGKLSVQSGHIQFGDVSFPSDSHPLDALVPAGDYLVTVATATRIQDRVAFFAGIVVHLVSGVPATWLEGPVSGVSNNIGYVMDCEEAKSWSKEFYKSPENQTSYFGSVCQAVLATDILCVNIAASKAGRLNMVAFGIDSSETGDGTYWTYQGYNDNKCLVCIAALTGLIHTPEEREMAYM